MTTLRSIFFLTGHPGVGKTTVLLKAIQALKERGFKVGGMVSREIREGGSRVGFIVSDLATGNEGWLVHIRREGGPTVGKYKVCLEDLESIGAKAILDAVSSSDIIVIDEVGPMELHSRAFKEAVSEALKSGKIIVGTIHYRVSDPIIATIRRCKDARIIEVTEENRDKLADLIAEEISRIFQRNDSKGYSPRTVHNN